MRLMFQPLSPETERRVTALFPADQRAEVTRLLVERCGNNLPGLGKQDQFQLERVRFAALKVSRGDLARLRSAVELAEVDWRDLLMGADFGSDVNAHKNWFPES